jgi:hypothetical protein
MGRIFTLEADTLAIIRDALDDLISELGKECLLVYPPRWVACAACVAQPQGNRPSSRWKTGGPLPINAASPCPLCNGQGRRAEEESETLTMSCQWDPREFPRLFPELALKLRAPYSTLRTKCYLEQAPKLMRCDHLRLQVPIEGVSTRRFVLASAPSDQSSIVQDRYAVAYWHQAG